MANIDKQMIARLPISEDEVFTFDYRSGWCIPVKRIWAKMELDRYTFRLANDEGLFECGPRLAKEISRIVGSTLKADCVDTDKADNVKVIIAKNEKNETGYSIGVYTNGLPKKNVLARSWAAMKKVFI